MDFFDNKFPELDVGDNNVDDNNEDNQKDNDKENDDNNNSSRRMKKICVKK